MSDTKLYFKLKKIQDLIKNTERWVSVMGVFSDQFRVTRYGFLGYMSSVSIEDERFCISFSFGEGAEEVSLLKKAADIFIGEFEYGAITLYGCDPVFILGRHNCYYDNYMKQKDGGLW